MDTETLLVLALGGAAVYYFGFYRKTETPLVIGSAEWAQDRTNRFGDVANQAANSEYVVRRSKGGFAGGLTPGSGHVIDVSVGGKSPPPMGAVA